MVLLLTYLLCGIIVINAKTIGPCTLGTTSNSSRMNCTLNGYFELVQCFGDFCICVDPKTGEEVLQTKTKSNTTIPICGACHAEQAMQISKNIVSNQPACEPKTGSYREKQCVSDNYCWCVDVETGTRKKGDIKENYELTCAKKPEISLSIDSESDIHEEKFKRNDDFEDYPVPDPLCKLPKSSGQNCSENMSKIQWYFDYDVADCLAFRYEGCSGNENRFASISDCWRTCKFADMGGCSGKKKAAKNPKGEMIVCEGPSISKEQCPAGYVCQMQAFFGICCNEKSEELYRRNYSPVCAKGTQPSKVFSGGFHMNILGKSCADNFCPKGTTCHKLEVLAHCCLTNT